MAGLCGFLEEFLTVKLATLKSGGRDGTLIVVDRALKRAVRVPEIAPTLQAALDGWNERAIALLAVYERLNQGVLEAAFDLDVTALAAPLPRAYQWLDGSAYLSHVERVRKARGADLPQNLREEPLMYQGGSDGFLGPRDPILAADERWGIDYEAEIAVITDDVAMGLPAQTASAHIRLLTLVNDVSLRNLIPSELAKGFGFIHGKPASALAPVAATPDELGAAWDGARVRLPLLSYVNDARYGSPNAGVDMAFDFPALISHAAKTRNLGAGTIIGAGTVSNSDAARGVSCIVERRVLEILGHGQASTPFLRFGDRVRIEMLDEDGHSVFGAIEQAVAQYQR